MFTKGLTMLIYNQWLIFILLHWLLDNKDCYKNLHGLAVSAADRRGGGCRENNTKTKLHTLAEPIICVKKTNRDRYTKIFPQ